MKGPRRSSRTSPSRALSAVGALLTVATVAACKDPLIAHSALVAPVNSGGSSSGSGIAPLQQTFNEDCPAGSDWMPADGGPPPPVRMFTPPPHPDTECPFYRGAYQNFLIATVPLANGDPALVEFPTIADTFTSKYNTSHQRNTGTPMADPYGNPGGAAAAAIVRGGAATGKAWLGAVHQAGGRQLLVDRNGHTLYYGLHMNQAFVDFVKTNGLDTQDGIINSVKNDPDLQFPPGVTEFKTAWIDIDPRDFPSKADGKTLGKADGVVPPPTDFASDPGDYSNYITTMAWIPWLSQEHKTDGSLGAITEDPEHPIQRKVALVAIHCVYTLPGHPEFIWGSIQHVNIHEIDPAPQTYAGVSIYGMPDSTPNGTGQDGGQAILPNPNIPGHDVSTITASPDMNHNYLLFAKGTPENASNVPVLDSNLGFVEATQSFTSASMSIARLFPGSKSSKLSPDTAIFSLNSNLNTLFGIDGGVTTSTDKRQNYRLVAAVWMDKPDLFTLGPTVRGTTLGTSLQNDEIDPATMLPLQPLVVAAQKTPPDPVADISQGVSCGTPIGQDPLSGDDPNATGFNNTTPGCDTRYDDLDLPDAGNPRFELDGGPLNPLLDFQNGSLGTDSPFSILGGEDRLSSTSMETFTQNGSFNNCFQCHNTQPISTNGVSQTPACVSSSPGMPGYPGQPAIANCQAATTIPFAAKINVSHMFSEFILGEQEEALRHPDGGT